MRIGLVEFLLILAIASLTIGPQVALFVDRWMRRANRANARAARRRAEYAAQMAVERDALLKRFRTASTVFGVCILLALVYALVFRPIDTPPQGYTAPDVRQDTGTAQTALAADHKGTLDLGEYQGVDCIRTHLAGGYFLSGKQWRRFAELHAAYKETRGSAQIFSAYSAFFLHQNPCAS